MAQWHCAIGGQRYGPIDEAELRNWISQGRVTSSDLVWREGMSEWQALNTVAEFNNASGTAADTPPPPPGGAGVQALPQQGNGLAVAGMVLGIVAMVMLCVWYVSFPCAIIGLALSVLGLKRSRETGGAGSGMAKAGLILSIIALSLAAIIIIMLLVGVALLPWQQMMEEALGPRSDVFRAFV